MNDEQSRQVVAERTMKFIQEKVSTALEPYINTKNTEETRRNIISTMMSVLSKVLQQLGGASIHDIDFDVVQNENEPTMMNIVPRNFFTFLLLYGIHYPPALDSLTRYVPREGPYIGTVFTWNEKNKTGAMKPPDMIMGKFESRKTF